MVLKREEHIHFLTIQIRPKDWKQADSKGHQHCLIDYLKYYEEEDSGGPHFLMASFFLWSWFVVPLQELIEAPYHDREYSGVINDFKYYSSAEHERFLGIREVILNGVLYLLIDVIGNQYQYLEDDS